MSVSAMKCALQSLESVEKVNGWNKDSIVGRHCTQSAHFLRQAIAEAEKQEPVAWFIQYEYRHEFLWREPTAHEKNSASEIKPLYTRPVYASDISQECVDETAKDRHELVQQPDLARVGEVGVWGHQREWVGLTDQEIYDIREDHTYNDEEFNEWGFAKDIEAKLKEKNVPQP